MTLDTRGGETLPLDGDGNPIHIAAGVKMRDGTGTPVKSPQTITATPVAIIPPVGATSVVFYVAGAEMQVGTDATLSTGSFKIPDGTMIDVPMANSQTLWVKRDAGVSVTLNYYFKHLNPTNA